jgi:hypothetical protein
MTVEAMLHGVMGVKLGDVARATQDVVQADAIAHAASNVC